MKKGKIFLAINFSESTKEEQILRKVAKSLYFLLITPDELQSNSSDNCTRHYNAKILNLFAPELQLIKTKPEIKNKLKGLLNKLKKFKVQTVLVLYNNKRNDSQIFYLCTKTIASDLDIKHLKHLNKAFKSMHQSIIIKIKIMLVKFILF